MAGLGAGDGPLVRDTSQTGAVDTGWGGGLLGVFAAGTIVTLRGYIVALILGTLGVCA